MSCNSMSCIFRASFYKILRCICFCVAMPWRGECIVSASSRPVAWTEVACDRGMARRSPTHTRPRCWLATPRWTRRRRHHQRPRPTQARYARAPCCRRRLPLGLLRGTLARSLLRQIGYDPSRKKFHRNEILKLMLNFLHTFDYP